MNGERPAHPKLNITASTGVSIGIMVVVIAALFTVMNGINTIGSKIEQVSSKQETNKMEFLTEIDKIKTDVAAIHANKTSVTGTQFFKWAVHLQQANPQIKVPEPEVDAR
jgi:flagellar basal body-associated protein FliL